jgi:NAD(P)-dependent dehydrogenase (short-subunit alcohol dehydrogenase family)
VTVGWVPTEGEVALRDKHSQDNAGEDFLARIGKRAPLGRLETVEDIAAGVSYLVSEEAGHVTGCELNVSGGLWIG